MLCGIGVKFELPEGHASVHDDMNSEMEET